MTDTNKILCMIWCAAILISGTIMLATGFITYLAFGKSDPIFMASLAIMAVGVMGVFLAVLIAPRVETKP